MLMANLICSLFEDRFNLKNQQKRENGGEFMWFGLSGYHSKTLYCALYAPSTYVGVYAAWDKPHKNIHEVKGWRRLSYHDSRWRSDGVETIFCVAEVQQLTTFDSGSLFDTVVVESMTSKLQRKLVRHCGRGEYDK